MSTFALELKDIEKKFGEEVALQKINLQVNEGEFFFLLGPSGCGKTTLLKIIAGLEEPTSGRVMIKGRDESAFHANKRNTATVFQEWALFPHMNVYDNIAFGLRMHKMPKSHINDKVNELLDLIHMSGLEKRMAYELSGGQQQRVAIARSLAIEPDILLLDEPLSNLDLALRQNMRLELINLHNKIKKTFIYVTHDQTEALTMGDNLVVMKKGKIEQVGSPREIYLNPVNDYVATFIGETNEVCGTISELTPDPIMETRGGLKLKVDIRDSSLQKGSEAVAVIRPEHTKLMCVNEDVDNYFDVIVDNIAYFGPSLRLYCHTEQGDIAFFVNVFAETELASAVEVGTRVAIGLDKQYALCYAVK
ncbi:MAG: ABC transporter ATP-binding protein [Desulfobacula sp.]|jgi:spermidine/putrescine transport system ATP-binding protein|nr:ABC transporter ATP-binding protein [Desulfobacula sp.]